MVWRKNIGIIDQNYDDVIIVIQKEIKDTFYFNKNSIDEIFVNIDHNKILIVSDSIQVDTISKKYSFIKSYQEESLIGGWKLSSNQIKCLKQTGSVK